MTSLVTLEGELYRYEDGGVFHPVQSVEDADCVMFLCPACFAANDGPVGTHSIRVDFEGKGVPDSHCIRNSDGKPVRWQASGSSLRDLTLRPSIAVHGGCAWHGFVTAGDAT